MVLFISCIISSLSNTVKLKLCQWWWKVMTLWIVKKLNWTTVASPGLTRAPVLAGRQWVFSLAGTPRRAEPRLRACWDGRDGRRVPSPQCAETQHSHISCRRAQRAADQRGTNKQDRRSAAGQEVIPAAGAHLRFCRGEPGEVLGQSLSGMAQKDFYHSHLVHWEGLNMSCVKWERKRPIDIPAIYIKTSANNQRPSV